MVFCSVSGSRRAFLLPDEERSWSSPDDSPSSSRCDGFRRAPAALERRPPDRGRLASYSWGDSWSAGGASASEFGVGFLRYSRNRFSNSPAISPVYGRIGSASSSGRSVSTEVFDSDDDSSSLEPSSSSQSSLYPGLKRFWGGSINPHVESVGVEASTTDCLGDGLGVVN